MREPSILIVEDDELETQALLRAFERVGLDDCSIHVACDGQEALEMLLGVEGHHALPMPNVVLLDINMPRMDGHEFLKAIRADARLRHLVVFVLTTSRDVVDIRAAYGEHVAGYIVKASSPTQLDELGSMLARYLKLVQPPLPCSR